MKYAGIGIDLNIQWLALCALGLEFKEQHIYEHILFYCVFDHLFAVTLYNVSLVFDYFRGAI